MILVGYTAPNPYPLCKYNRIAAMLYSPRPCGARLFRFQHDQRYPNFVSVQRFILHGHSCLQYGQRKVIGMRHEFWTTIASEFSELPDLATIVVISVRLMLAALLGGILGFERERKARSAGVRTHMLVAVGAALFVLGPLQSGMPIEDMSRVLQGVVQGIGFLGAGAIIVRRAQHQVEGLTTAASIWVTAGIGVIVGLGLEATAILSAVVVLIILAVVPYVLPQVSSADRDLNDPRA